VAFIHSRAHRFGKVAGAHGSGVLAPVQVGDLRAIIVGMNHEQTLGRLSAVQLCAGSAGLLIALRRRRAYHVPTVAR
jgi:hypothetical protein